MAYTHFSSRFKSIITPLINIHFEKISFAKEPSPFDKERFILLSKIVIKSEIAFIEKLHKDYFNKLSLNDLKNILASL